MKQIKWRFLLLAIAAGGSMLGTGISIGQRSLTGTIISIILLVVIFGLGFSMKKKMINNGEL